MIASRKLIFTLSSLSLAAAVAILLLNAIGFLVPLRHPEVNGYVDFAMTSNRTAEDTLGRLQMLSTNRDDLSRQEFVFQATKFIHEGMAHIEPGEVSLKGFEHFGMTVPITENWILWLLRYLKPDTYEDYEFCSYRKAVERGTGRCGQQALALVSYLSQNEINTGFVALGGHAIAAAEVSPNEWHLLDPDYGGVIPFDHEQAQKAPERVLPYYWNQDIVLERNLLANYATDNTFKPGGVEARYGRACYIEHAAYVLKWLAPLLLLLVGLTGLIWYRRI